MQEFTITEVEGEQMLVLPKSNVRKVQALMAAAHQAAHDAGGVAVREDDQASARMFMFLARDMSVAHERAFGKPL